MDYKKIHDMIIERAKDRKLEGYVETHHIVPRCTGGTDELTNLVKLTAREHFLVHKLLCEIYPFNKKLLFAFSCMALRTSSDSNKRGYNVTARDHEFIKTQRALLGHSSKTCELISKNNARYWKNKQSPRSGTKGIDGKGKRHSNETRKKISNNAKVNSNYGMKGKHHTYETIQKISIAQKGKPRKTIGALNGSYKHVPINELEKLIRSGMSVKRISEYFNIADSTLKRKYHDYWSCKTHKQVLKHLKII